MNTLTSGAAWLFGWAWEARRAAYARGWRRPARVPARVVSIGNLTVGGAGKTTLTLALAAEAIRQGRHVAVVCRRYRPGPHGRGDEEAMYIAALGAPRVFAGVSKRALAGQAAASGASLVLVDDGFSHWPLARDLDVVLLDATDLWGGGALLPAGRLREPRRALQRAAIVVVTRIDEAGRLAHWLEQVRPYAPAAMLAAARHRVAAVRTLGGEPRAATGAAHVVTATGNPQAVVASARDAGFAPVTLSAYRDHHWFTVAEARSESARAAGATLLLTAKDAVRWPVEPSAPASSAKAAVLEVGWEWLAGGDAVTTAVLGAAPRAVVPAAGKE